jgi:hypothetical protein
VQPVLLCDLVCGCAHVARDWVLYVVPTAQVLPGGVRHQGAAGEGRGPAHGRAERGAASGREGGCFAPPPHPHHYLHQLFTCTPSFPRCGAPSPSAAPACTQAHTQARTTGTCVMRACMHTPLLPRSSVVHPTTATPSSPLAPLHRGAQVYDIFRNISDADCMTLGFNPRFSRPENLIITVRCAVPRPRVGAMARDAVLLPLLLFACGDVWGSSRTRSTPAYPLRRCVWAALPLLSVCGDVWGSHRIWRTLACTLCRLCVWAVAGAAGGTPARAPQRVVRRREQGRRRPHVQVRYSETAAVSARLCVHARLYAPVYWRDVWVSCHPVWACILRLPCVRVCACAGT